MTISRRKLIVTLGLGSVASLLPRAAFAAYPDRPIHLIVPFAPGGNADIVGRIVGERISSALGQPVVVDNRGGAGGSIGAEAVARATPDGYTLFVGSNGPLTVNPFVQAKLAYDPLKDFAPVALTSYVPHVHHPQQRGRVQDAAGFHRRLQEAADQHRHQRRRQRHAYDARAVQSGDRRQAHAYPLQQRRPADARPDRRQYPGGDDGILHRIAAAQRRQGAHSRRRLGAALQARARRRHLHRGRREGFHRAELYRHSGARRHAARHRRAVAEGDRRRPRRRPGARQAARHGRGNRHARADDVEPALPPSSRPTTST